MGLLISIIVIIVLVILAMILNSVYFWVSQWYSKDIAELELLDLKNIGKSKDGE